MKDPTTPRSAGKLQLLWKMTNDHLASYAFRLVCLRFGICPRDTEHLDKHIKKLPVNQRRRCSMSRRQHGQMTGSFSFFLLLIQSVQFSCSVVSDSLRPHGLQHARPPCPSPTLGACSSSCPLSPDAIQLSHLLLIQGPAVSKTHLTLLQRPSPPPTSSLVSIKIKGHLDSLIIC